MIRDFMAQFLFTEYFSIPDIFYPGYYTIPSFFFFPPVKSQMSKHSYIVTVTVKFSDFQKGVTGSFKTWSRGWCIMDQRTNYKHLNDVLKNRNRVIQ